MQGVGWLGLFEHKKFEVGVFMVVEVPAVDYSGYRRLSQVRTSSVEEKGWCLQLEIIYIQVIGDCIKEYWAHE